MEFSEIEWLARCAVRLHAQWPRIGREQRDELARELWLEPRWRQLDPEVAAREWLLQGIPSTALSGSALSCTALS